MRQLARLPLAALLALLAACGAQPNAGSSATVAPTAEPAPAAGGELSIFAATSLNDAFKEIGAAFEAANPGAKLAFNFAGSQQLAQQIGQGAPVDVFASANASQMNAVIKSGLVVSGTQHTFVRNRLVVIFPKDNPGKIEAIKDLASPGLKLVLADKAVPVGQYSLDVLAKASKLPAYTDAFSPTVLANVVSYEDNVRAVLSKVALGEADAGIVYTSDIALDSAEKVGKLDIPDELNVIAAYPIAPIKGSASAALAQKFVDYVLAPDGQQVLAKYGFIPAAAPK
jgi:molybdate transport system substrate-binding protein